MYELKKRTVAKNCSRKNIGEKQMEGVAGKKRIVRKEGSRAPRREETKIEGRKKSEMRSCKERRQETRMGMDKECSKERQNG